MRGILITLAAVALSAAPALAQTDGNTTDDDAAGGTSGGALTGPMDGTATSIAVETPVGSQVCWTVAGTGRVGHVAIHWDDESHQVATVNGSSGAPGTDGTVANGTAGATGEANATFADYDLGFAYPDDTAELDPGGYALPGRFCATVASGATLYVVAHVMDVNGAPGLLSREVVVTSTTTGGDAGGANATTDDGAPQESNPPRTDTPGVGALAAVAAVGVAALAVRRQR